MEFGLSKVGRKAVGDISEQCVTSEERGEKVKEREGGMICGKLVEGGWR